MKRRSDVEVKERQGQPADDVLDRVANADLKQLGDIRIDDVLLFIDRGLENMPTYLDLFRRWEKQQWAVSDLDFTIDKRDWANLPPPVRATLTATMKLFFVGEQIVTDTLAPVLHAAPAEDERIFLATQLADEARHTVFFQRYFEEVLGHAGGIRAALNDFAPALRAGYRRIFYTDLPNAIERCRLNPKDPVAFVEAVVTYHLIVEGYLALGGQRTVLRLLRRVGILPGFVAGFTAVARDESRHIGFGVLALRRRVVADAQQARVIARKVHDLLEPAVRVVVGPDEKLPFQHVTEVPEPMRVDPIEARQFAVESLTKRLRAAGLAERAVNEVGGRMYGLYDQLWSEYESTHGVEHPVRYWQQRAASA
jgi:ribonucleoside-diphosphate reductase beta chain